MNLRSLRNRWRQKFLLKYGDFVKFFYGEKNILKGNNIVVLHQGRSGSTLLAKKLSGSPSHKIKSFSEIYSNSYIPMEEGMKDIIHSLSYTTKLKNKFYEIKFGLGNHLSFSMEKEFLELIKSGCKFLILIRKDALSQAKSNVYGFYSDNKYHYKLNEKVSFKKIKINRPFLIGGMFFSSLEEVANYINSQNELLIHFLDKLSAIYEIIYYEDIVEKNKIVEKSICNLLKINGLIFSKKIKTIKTPINYDTNLIID